MKMIYGCDTETFRVGQSKGLKSIQLYGDGGAFYFTVEDWTQSDEDIRYEISSRFFNHIMSTDYDMEIAFFNLNFDVSQFLKFMVSELGLEIWHDYSQVKKGYIKILETELKLYCVEIRTFKGRLIRMIDIANFLVGVSLNDACKSWIGETKIELDDKRFDKCPATELEKTYAMKDAELTYKLFLKLIDAGVIEGHTTVTIAGRTVRHFKEYMKTNYHMTFDEYFYPGLNEEEISCVKEIFERELRVGTRGGITQSYQKGTFENCTHIDARSMYPTQCVRDFIPVGPLLREEPDGPHGTIVYPIGYYELKDGKVPCVQWQTKAMSSRYRYKNDYDVGEYVRDFFLDGSYPIWTEEYEIIKQCYEVIDEHIEKQWYIRYTENIILKNYVNMLYEGKKNNAGSKKLYYKYLLNALYGKFLTRPDGVNIEYICQDNIWKRIKTATEKKTYYLPLGSWIAMMGRVTLMKAILSINAEVFLYCDTDSMIIKKPAFPDITIGSDLGQWAVENDNVKVSIIGPKTYQEKLEDGRIITKCAGMPTSEKEKLGWLELKENLVIKTTKPRRDPETWAINFEPLEFTVKSRPVTFLHR